MAATPAATLETAQAAIRAIILIQGAALAAIPVETLKMMTEATRTQTPVMMQILIPAVITAHQQKVIPVQTLSQKDTASICLQP